MGEPVQFDVNDLVARTIRSEKRVSRALLILYVVVWYAISFSVLFSAGFPAFLVAVGAIYLVFSYPMYRVDGVDVWRTEKPPDAVREEFTELLNPLTATTLVRAAAVRDEVDYGREVVATLEFETLRVFSKEMPIRILERDDGSIRTLIGEDGENFAVTVTIEPTDTGSRIEMASAKEGIRLRHFLYFRLADRYHQRRIDHFGYREVDSTARISLSLW